MTDVSEHPITRATQAMSIFNFWKRPPAEPTTKVIVEANFLGQIMLLPYTRTPAGWLPCEGQMVQISRHAALFALLGTTYGGDGVMNFALPNLKDKAPDPNVRYCIAMVGPFPSMD